MKNLPSILSSSIGNILEWYDFGLFSIFSSVFSQLFFPAQNPTVALIATFGIFAMGFLCRPIGALIFGYLGDKNGRANTLRLSILMISLPTLLISFLPTYESIGILAPILLMIIRMWQGFSIGGEYSGNLIYLAETSPKRYRATFVSIVSMGANFGILLAALVGILTTFLFSKEILLAWGWRMPYLLSGLVSLGIYRFRLQLKETDVFATLKNNKLICKNPITFVFQKNLRQLFLTLGLVCMGSTFYYFCFIYIPIYLRQVLHYSLQNISMMMSGLILLMIFLVPLAGFVCDKVGRRKMLLFNAILISLITIPGFYFMHHYFFIAIFILILFTLASSLEQGTTPISVIENFPLPARYTGVSLGYNIGNGILGGTVPMICEWLTESKFLVISPALYIASFAVITAIVVFFFIPETARKSLHQVR